MTPPAPAEAPTVGLPRPRPSPAKQEQARLLREYHEGVARREREAREAAAARPVVHEARSRFRHDAEPVNEKRLPAVDGPPPAGFDLERPAPDSPPRERHFGRGPGARKKPTCLNLASPKRQRVAG